MTIPVNGDLLIQAVSLAQTSAHVAHEAQPYPQDTEIFKGLATLSSAMSAAALRLLAEAIPAAEPAKGEEPPAAGA